MTSEFIESFRQLLKKNNILFAFLDVDSELIRIFVRSNDKESVDCVLKGSGWKAVKDKSGDVYLYGMDHFLYYKKERCYLTVCFQVACRSTLNGEWVPLDQKINNTIIDGIISDDSMDIYPIPGADDLLCYLLAKCVYTEKNFSESDQMRIQLCLERVTNGLTIKLSRIFFCFTSRILEMIKAQDYDHIIEELLSFAEYEVIT